MSFVLRHPRDMAGDPLRVGDPVTYFDHPMIVTDIVDGENVRISDMDQRDITVPAGAVERSPVAPQKTYGLPKKVENALIDLFVVALLFLLGCGIYSLFGSHR
jgi:hypothetical protein